MGNQRKLERAKKELSLPTPPLKQSSLNFSPVEVDILLRLLADQHHLLTGRVADGTPLSASHIRQAWNKMAKEVSQVSNVARSGSDVREKWTDLKQRTRQKLARNERAKLRTGKRQVTPYPLSAVEERVFSLIDVTQVLGIDGTEEGMTYDKVGSKVRVEVDKLKDGIAKAVQNRESKDDVESSLPESPQYDLLTTTDEDDESEMEDEEEEEEKKATTEAVTNGPKSTAVSSKTSSPGSPATKKAASALLKVSPPRMSAVGKVAVNLASNESLVNIDPVVTLGQRTDRREAAGVVVVSDAAASSVSRQISATKQTPTSAPFANGEVGGKRSRSSGDSGDLDDWRRRKRVRQQKIERVKSHTVAQRLTDIEANRLEMERSFAERRLLLDRELALTRQAADREMQERKLKMQQDFCNRIAGTFEGILQIYSRQQEKKSSEPSRINSSCEVETQQAVPQQQALPKDTPQQQEVLQEQATPQQQAAPQQQALLKNAPQQQEVDQQQALSKDAPQQHDVALQRALPKDAPQQQEVPQQQALPMDSPQQLEVPQQQQAMVEEEIFMADLGIEEVTVETLSVEVSASNSKSLNSRLERLAAEDI